jgi:hypothetical protein
MMALGLGASGQGNAAFRTGQPQAIAKSPQRAVNSAASCSGCHDDPKNIPRELREKDLICNLTEYPVWKNQDRHQIAYSVLQKQGRGPEIAKRLGIKLDAPNNPCVRCHGVVVPPGSNPVLFVPENEGVTCIACHGAFDDWVTEHQKVANAAWKQLNRKDKERFYGMHDLWDARTRVDTCLSCHVGDVRQVHPDETKFVTHAMYAAGHPPLPSIEVGAFSNLMPRHWEYLRQKNQQRKSRLGYRDDRLEEAELVAIAALTVVSKTLSLISTPPAKGENGTTFPDFALFDCSACHHDLTTSDSSWRQARGWKNPPGRPTPPSWPTALVRVGLEAADSQKADAWFQSFRGLLDQFNAAMTEQPFGNLQNARPVAQKIAKLLEEPLAALDAKAWAKPGENVPVVDKATALRMLHRLGRLAASSAPDHDSARQMVWAYRTVYVELFPANAENENIKEIKATKEILARLDQYLASDLHARSGPGVKEIEKLLPARLGAASKYTPADFHRDFAAMIGNLPPPPPPPLKD